MFTEQRSLFGTMNSSKNSSTSDVSFATNDLQNNPLDIVVVDNDEQALYRCLEEIQKTTQQLYGAGKWLGITCDMQDSVVQRYNLWVELEGIPLGRHWFQLKSIKVENCSIQLHIKHLRTAELPIERRSLGMDEYVELDYRKFLTYDSICGVLKFLALFVMSILALTGNALWYISDYSLKMFHEFSGLVEVCTPIVIETIHCITRCVGGLFWLIYVFWRGDRLPANRMQAFVTGNQQQKYRPRLAIRQ